MEKKDFDDFFDNLSEQLKDNSLFKFHEEIADIIIADREDAWEEIVKAFHKHTGFTVKSMH
jgi:CRISPR/Cas system CSM-associated protein Csm2 small subunit